MNIWQKTCIVFGAIAIALMFLIFPVKATKEVPLTGFATVGKVFNKTTEIYIDYQATALKSIGVVMLTGALTVLLGFMKDNKKEED